MWIASAACGQGAIDPRADTRARIIAPKYLPGYDPFNPSGVDNPSEPLVLEPGPFDPPPTGGPTADFRELIEFHAADHHAISAFDRVPPLGVPAPGSVLLIALGAAGLAAPRRRAAAARGETARPPQRHTAKFFRTVRSACRSAAAE